jgi:hypothetical protein
MHESFITPEDGEEFHDLLLVHVAGAPLSIRMISPSRWSPKVQLGERKTSPGGY